MALQFFNTIHFMVWDVRGLPSGASRIGARFREAEVTVAELEDGAVKVKGDPCPVRLTGPFGSAEAVWLHLYESGLFGDSILGSCMVFLPLFDLSLRPFENWVPFITKEGAFVGRAAVQMMADCSRSLLISVLRGACDEEDGERLGGAAEPIVAFQLREKTFQTTAHTSGGDPVWDDTFEMSVASRDKLQVKVLDSLDPTERAVSSEVMGIDLLSRIGNFMWIPILNPDGAHTGKILLKIDQGAHVEQLPIRVLEITGLDARSFKKRKPIDLYLKLSVGKEQEARTSVQSNEADIVWDEEFVFDMLPYQSLKIQVKSSEFILFKDGLVGQAFLSAEKMLQHRGEKVWVDVSNTPGASEPKILLWICPPPGVVYLDNNKEAKRPLTIPGVPDDSEESSLIQKDEPEEEEKKKEEPEKSEPELSTPLSPDTAGDSPRVLERRFTYTSAEGTPLDVRNYPEEYVPSPSQALAATA